MAYAPTTRRSAARVASKRPLLSAAVLVERLDLAVDEVGDDLGVRVGEELDALCLEGSWRRATWFSMIPLWTTATGPAEWGWALASLGRPWVAQRVCPMFVAPAKSVRFSSASPSLASLPSVRTISMLLPSWMAMPAES